MAKKMRSGSVNELVEKYAARVVSCYLLDQKITHRAVAKRCGLDDSERSQLMNAIGSRGREWVCDALSLSSKKAQHIDEFYISVSTSCDHHAKPIATLEKGREKYETFAGYQLWVVDRIKEYFLSERNTDMFLASVDILVGGPHDIIMHVYTNKSSSVHDFVINTLRVIPHVSATATASVRKDPTDLSVNNQCEESQEI